MRKGDKGKRQQGILEENILANCTKSLSIVFPQKCCLSIPLATSEMSKTYHLFKQML